MTNSTHSSWYHDDDVLKGLGLVEQRVIGWLWIGRGMSYSTAVDGIGGVFGIRGNRMVMTKGCLGHSKRSASQWASQTDADRDCTASNDADGSDKCQEWGPYCVACGTQSITVARHKRSARTSTRRRPVTQTGAPVCIISFCSVASGVHDLGIGV